MAPSIGDLRDAVNPLERIERKLRGARARFWGCFQGQVAVPQDSYAAANVADALRRQLVQQRESFVFEMVFSDPEGDKLTFLKEAAQAGCTVVLCFNIYDKGINLDIATKMRKYYGANVLGLGGLTSSTSTGLMSAGSTTTCSGATAAKS